MYPPHPHFAAEQLIFLSHEEDRQMHRSRRILIMCHCLLNANAKIVPLASVQGVFTDVILPHINEGCGLFQLPCPETSYLGMYRWG